MANERGLMLQGAGLRFVVIGHRRQNTMPGAVGQTTAEFGGLLQRAQRAPHRRLDGLLLSALQALLGITMAHVTTIMSKLSISHFPKRAAALGTGQRGWGA